MLDNEETRISCCFPKPISKGVGHEKRLSNKVIRKFFEENASDIINLVRYGDGSCLDPISSEKSMSEAEFVSSFFSSILCKIELEFKAVM